MRIVCVLSIICVLLSCFNKAQSQAYGGALSYKIIYINNDTVKLRLLNKLVIKGTVADAEKCSSKCGELVDSQQLFITTIEKFDYFNTTANANQTSATLIDSSFYCNSGYPTGPATNTLFISGKREFDVVLPITNKKTLSFEYKGTFKGDSSQDDYLTRLDNLFKLKVNIDNRNGQNKPNTPPNLDEAKLFETFIATKDNSYQIKVKDDDNDQITCQYDLITDCYNECIDIHNNFNITLDCRLLLFKDVYKTATTDPLVIDIRVNDHNADGTVKSSVPYYISINIIKNEADLKNSIPCNSRENILYVNPFNIKDGSSVLKSFTLLNILFVLGSIVYNNI